MFKKSLKQKLRYKTSAGLVTTEQLFDLSESQLDEIAVYYDDLCEKSPKKSFIKEVTNEKNSTYELQRDVVIDILNEKVEERKKIANEREIKAHNEEIYALMAKNDKEELGKLSNEELRKRLK